MNASRYRHPHRNPDPRQTPRCLLFCAPLIAAVAALFLACASPTPCINQNQQNDNQPEKIDVSPNTNTPLFSRLYGEMKKWQGLKNQELQEFNGEIKKADQPAAAALYETEIKDGYLFVSHVGRHVAITFFDAGFGIKDMKAFPAKLGFSACIKHGLILTLHKHPAAGQFIDSRVLVKTDKSSIILQYNID